jgi:hypothetical protein
MAGLEGIAQPIILDEGCLQGACKGAQVTNVWVYLMAELCHKDADMVVLQVCS